MSIEAKIALVMTESEIAINAGADQGVARGDVVTLWDSWQVPDPDTQEVLAVFRRPRVRFRVTTVEGRAAVAQTYEYVTKPRDEGLPLFSALTVTGTSRLRQRVTTSPSNQDYRTVCIEIGASVEVTPGERETATTESDDGDVL